MHLDDTIANLETMATFLRVHRPLFAAMKYDDDKPYGQAHADVAVQSDDDLTVYFNGTNDAEVKELMARARKVIGGMWEKKGGDYYFTLRRKIDGVTVDLTAQRAKVCEKRVVRTETVKVAARPAVEEHEVEREVVEWDCGPILPAHAEAV